MINIYLELKYSGTKADRLIKQCFKKLHRCFKKEKQVKFILKYQTTKLSFFTNTKDKLSPLSQSSLVYKFNCPGCNSSYIGKTERTLHERTAEHAYENKKNEEQSAIYEHISTCPNYDHIQNMFATLNNDIMINKFNISQIRNNTIIIDKANNWNVLLFKEALYIRRQRPSLNCGLKASKELQLF